jgi:hypothetical protein
LQGDLLQASAGKPDDARKRRVIQSRLAMPDLKTFLSGCLSSHTAKSRTITAR